MSKLISRYVGLVVFFLVFSLNANAQDRAREGAKKVTDNMKEQLSLNDSQYAKVQQINLEFLQKAAENQESGKSQIEKQKKHKQLDDDRDKKLKSVLSEEQNKKYVATKIENRKKLKEYFQEKE
jgi:hypothetical protein